MHILQLNCITFLTAHSIILITKAQVEHNMSVPEWIGDKSAAVARFESLQTLLFGIGSSTDALRRLRVGPLLHTVLAHWRAIGELSPADYAKEVDVNSYAPTALFFLVQYSTVQYIESISTSTSISTSATSLHCKLELSS